MLANVQRGMIALARDCLAKPVSSFVFEIGLPTCVWARSHIVSSAFPSTNWQEAVFFILRRLLLTA